MAYCSPRSSSIQAGPLIWLQARSTPFSSKSAVADLWSRFSQHAPSWRNTHAAHDWNDEHRLLLNSAVSRVSFWRWTWQSALSGGVWWLLRNLCLRFYPLEPCWSWLDVWPPIAAVWPALQWLCAACRSYLRLLAFVSTVHFRTLVRQCDSSCVLLLVAIALFSPIKASLSNRLGGSSQWLQEPITSTSNPAAATALVGDSCRNSDSDVPTDTVAASANLASS